MSHVRSNHVEIYVCNVCTKTFNRKAVMIHHDQTVYWIASLNQSIVCAKKIKTHNWQLITGKLHAGNNLSTCLLVEMISLPGLISLTFNCSSKTFQICIISKFVTKENADLWVEISWLTHSPFLLPILCKLAKLMGKSCRQVFVFEAPGIYCHYWIQLL